MPSGVAGPAPFQLRRDLGVLRRIACRMSHGGNYYEEWVTTSQSLGIATRELRVRACGKCGRVKFDRRIVIDGEDVLTDD